MSVEPRSSRKIPAAKSESIEIGGRQMEKRTPAGSSRGKMSHHNLGDAAGFNLFLDPESSVVVPSGTPRLDRPLPSAEDQAYSIQNEPKRKISAGLERLRA